MIFVKVGIVLWVAFFIGRFFVSSSISTIEKNNSCIHRKTQNDTDENYRAYFIYLSYCMQFHIVDLVFVFQKRKNLSHFFFISVSY